MAVTEPKHGEAAAALLVAIVEDGAGAGPAVAEWTRQLLARFPEDTGTHVIKSMIELGTFTVGMLDELEKSGRWRESIRLAAWDLEIQQGEGAP